MCPQLVDFNADRHPDLVMGTFEGVAFLVPGSKTGFQQPQRILDASRKYLVNNNLSVFEYLSDSVQRNFSDAEFQTAVLDKVDAGIEKRDEQELAVTAQIPTQAQGQQPLDLLDCRLEP